MCDKIVFLNDAPYVVGDRSKWSIKPERSELSFFTCENPECNKRHVECWRFPIWESNEATDYFYKHDSCNHICYLCDDCYEDFLWNCAIKEKPEVCDKMIEWRNESGKLSHKIKLSDPKKWSLQPTLTNGGGYHCCNVGCNFYGNVYHFKPNGSTNPDNYFFDAYPIGLADGSDGKSIRWLCEPCYKHYLKLANPQDDQVDAAHQNVKLLTAHEARRLSDKRHCLIAIMEKINRSAQDGLFSCQVNNLEDEFNRRTLIDLGYAIDHEYDAGHYVSSTISWEV